MYFYLILLKIFIIIYKAGSLNLQASGYSNCIFNLVIADFSLGKSPKDASDRLITANQHDQLWTVTTASKPEINATTRTTLLNPVYFKEACSVNIVIVLNRNYCLTGYLSFIFGSRFYRPVRFHRKNHRK